MALKKGFCTHCKGDEYDRIFDVNKDAEVCYCPNCMAAMSPKEAIANYGGLISHYLKKASRALFETTQYLEAYQTFAHIIDLNDSIKVAHMGRILSMVYLSSTRKGKITFAQSLHQQEAPKMFHYQERANEYFNFLMLLLDALDTYESRLKKRITLHSQFYDMDCIILYLKRVDEIKDYKVFIAEEAKFFIDSNKEQFKEVIERVEKSREAYADVHKETFYTTDGYACKFHKFDANGTPILSVKGEQKVDKNGKPIINKYALTREDGKKSLIKEEVFVNNFLLYRLEFLSLPLALAILTVAIAGFIVAAFINVLAVKVLVIVLSAILAVGALVLVILHFAWKNRIKKKYYSGTNPFIFK
ncbi:MAG: hypothetical protein J6N95_01325 [Bacilli bacterium]|nr:hypothetical protein [Bacilli bacterium]